MSAKEVRIEGLQGFIESLARETMKAHEKRFGERIRFIREALQSIVDAADRFAVGVKHAWGTLDKLASEYGLRLAETVKTDASQLLDQKPDSTYIGAEAYHQAAVDATNRIITGLRKYLPRLHRVLNPEKSAMNTALAKLENSVKALGAALDESPGSRIESIQREVGIIVQKNDDLLKLRAENADLEAKFEELSAVEKQLSARIATLEAESGFLELRGLQDSLRSKEDEIKQFLSPLTKPLLKLERIATTSRESQVNTGILRALVERPVETIVTGQQFATLQLLDNLEEPLRRGGLGIEDRKRKKAEEVIEAVKHGEIDRLRSEYLAVQANISESIRQLKARGLMDEVDKLRSNIAETNHKKGEVASTQRDLGRKTEDLSQAILKLKKNIESEVSRLGSQKISIATT